MHAAPADVVAQNIGYKSANSGAALSALASLRYYGLLARPKEGSLAVSREVESYKFAPEEALRRTLLIRFLRCPSLYADLLDKYASGLPSDANLKYDLIQRGFIDQAADNAISVFKRSVDFVDYFKEDNQIAAEDTSFDPVEDADATFRSMPADVQSNTSDNNRPTASFVTDSADNTERELDRIPVRLPGSRRAWLLIPTPFYASDKTRLKAQIDLLLTEEDENG